MEATERQLAAWPHSVAEAQRYVEFSTLPTSIRHWGWAIAWADESRPGRGHDLSATYCDGEHLVQITLDVYGHGAVSVAETHWVHSSADEQCPCEPCKNERDEEDHDDHA